MPLSRSKEIISPRGRPFVAKEPPGAPPTGPVNGQPGPKLTAAIKAFQWAHRLSADGIVGPITRGALAAELAAKVENDAPPSPLAPDELGPAFFPDDEGASGPPDCLVLLPEVVLAEAARAASEGGNRAAV